MCNKEYLDKIAYEIKKPAMHLSFYERNYITPTTESHLGGVPFVLKKDVWPNCDRCSKDMQFIMQLREVAENGDVSLKAFYSCACELDKYRPNIRVIEYKNPNIDNVKVTERPNSIPYVEIRMEAAWSIPDWSVFKNLYPHQYEKMAADFPELVRDFPEIYGTYRYNNNMVSGEAYNGYGGYPEYLSAPKKTKCGCCKQDAEFVFQLDSLDEYNINWHEMTLYCFKCNTTGIYSFFLS